MKELIQSAQALLDFLEKYPHQLATDINGYTQDLQQQIEACRIEQLSHEP